MTDRVEAPSTGGKQVSYTDPLSAWEDAKGTIPEDNAQAAENLWDAGDKLAEAYAALQAENEALRAQAVKVKPLEWVEREYPDTLFGEVCSAKTPFVEEQHYRIYNDALCEDEVLEEDRFWFYGQEFYPTLDAAKAAAQADYERRILSAIDTVSVAQARKEALEEALEAARREHLEGDCTDDETDAAYDQGVTDCCCAICALIEKEDG